jgi:hypothetical protein
MQIPMWLEIIKDVGPLFVALIAAAIASAIQYRQWRTANDKIRLDLFDRRLSIVNHLTQLDLQPLPLDYSNYNEKIGKLIQDTKGYDTDIEESIERMRLDIYKLLFSLKDIDDNQDIDENASKSIS